MEAYECLITRRSIRQFKPDPIAAELLDKLVRAGSYAPSARNEQPWQFVVIDRRDLLDKIPEIHPHAAMLKQAPAAICVAADIRRDQCPGAYYWIQDCAAATENILLAAHALGLGGCWLGTYPRNERVEGLQKLLGMPEEVVPFSVIALGYPLKTPEQPERFTQTEVRRNSFQDNKIN